MPATFADQRRAQIMRMLDRDASVQVTDIAEAFGVSRVTARADLDALEQAGRLRRTHGGAVSLSQTFTPSIQDRRVNQHVEAKQAIADAALSFVADGDAILVDSGTTSLELVRALGTREGVTVVTGDLTIADFVDRSLPRTDCVLLGGTLRKGHRYTYGPLALRSLEALHPVSAFIAPTSFVPGRGFMTNHAAMAELKAAFLGSADRTYVLMDSSKVGAPGLLRFGGLDDADVVVMEADPNDVMREELSALGRADALLVPEA